MICRASAVFGLVFFAGLTACGGDTTGHRPTGGASRGGGSTAGGSSGGGSSGGGSTGAGTGNEAGAPGTGTAGPPAPIQYDGLEGLVRNPIVSHVFTADPSANVFGDRVYVYASHDLDTQDGYDMNDYHVFSSNDLVNWQDHGVALDARDVSWASKLYAPDTCYSEANDAYYLYFPDAGSGIGVAVSEYPGGPFVDAIGEPLINRRTPGVEDVEWIFDPSCFVDDDGQAYLYFGGGPEDSGDNARVVRLAEDMVSLADDTATLIEAPDFFEAAFMHKYDGRYYLSYATTFANHSSYIDYMISDEPMMGFDYAGTVLGNPQGNNSNNNHHSIVEYRGGWYIFYHNRVLSNRLGYSDFQRSITLDHLSYDSDGNIEQVPTRRGEVRQLQNLDAFSRLQAETMADQRGIEVDFSGDGGSPPGVMVTDIHAGDWIGYSQVDFGSGATLFRVRVASASSTAGQIELFVDGSERFSNLPGLRIGACEVLPTGGWRSFREVQCSVDETEGVHDLYLVFAGETTEALLNLDYFQFE